MGDFTDRGPDSLEAAPTVRAVAAAGRAAIPQALAALQEAQARLDVADLLESWQQRAACLQGYAQAYGRYCWPVQSLELVKRFRAKTQSRKERKKIFWEALLEGKSNCRLAA